MPRPVVFVSFFALAGAVKLSSMDHGAEFTQCIAIADFEAKTLDDDITLVDRVDGCCPEGSVPGAKWQASYKGAQIVCGFKDDGNVAISTGSSGGTKTCTYNKCYVDKQNLPCADGTKQLLNGCCKGTDATNKGFAAGCKNYYLSFNNVFSQKVQHCTTYHKDYSSLGYAGTQEKTDDQADGKLVPNKIYTYTPCSGGATATATTTAGDAADGATMPTAVMGFLAVMLAWF